MTVYFLFMSKSPVIYGQISKTRLKKLPWGSHGILWDGFDNLKTSGFLVDFKKETSYEAWADVDSENLCLVEAGSATLEWAGKKYLIKNKAFVFKVYPGQSPTVRPGKNGFRVLSVQMRHAKQSTRNKDSFDISKLDVIDTRRVPAQVYEFETLAQEIFTPNYKNGLGLIKFAFVNPIPIHRHPYSARLIRPISGKGYTYIEPNIYEAHADTYALIPTNTIHTNGNIPGNVLRLYAVQLPWVPSGIDEENIAGSPRFVKYVGITPPKKIWKTKKQFETLIHTLDTHISKR